MSAESLSLHGLYGDADELSLNGLFNTSLEFYLGGEVFGDSYIYSISLFKISPLIFEEMFQTTVSLYHQITRVFSLSHEQITTFTTIISSTSKLFQSKQVQRMFNMEINNTSSFRKSHEILASLARLFTTQKPLVKSITVIRKADYSLTEEKSLW